jgi:hypothetical protein
MSTASKTFEFYNPWSTKNNHINQPGITMPQMVNGIKPDPVLTLYSGKLEGSGWYKLGSRTHSVAYTISGGFIGTCTVQISTSPSPGENDWETLPDTSVRYYGNETTGSAGIAGGFSGAVSKPMRSDRRQFDGDYAWVRVRLDISRGTLQSIKYDF